MSTLRMLASMLVAFATTRVFIHGDLLEGILLTLGGLIFMGLLMEYEYRDNQRRSKVDP